MQLEKEELEGEIEMILEQGGHLNVGARKDLSDPDRGLVNSATTPQQLERSIAAQQRSIKRLRAAKIAYSKEKYSNFDIILDHRSRISQLDTIPRAPCDIPLLAPMLIGC